MKKRIGGFSLLAALLVVGAGVAGSPASAHTVAKKKKPYVCTIKPSSPACKPHPGKTPTTTTSTGPTGPGAHSGGGAKQKPHAGPSKPQPGKQPVVTGVGQSPGVTALPRTGGGAPTSPDNVGLGILGAALLALGGVLVRRFGRRS